MKDVIDRALALAREKGHAKVGEAHVLLALLDVEPVRLHMARGAQSRVRLEQRLREMLAAEWDARTYRSAPEPALAAELEAAIARARGRGLRGFFFGASVAEVFDHLIARRQLAEEIAFDVAPVRRLFNAVRNAANKLNHRVMLVDHAFLSLARKKGDRGRFARALEAIGRRPDEVQSSLFSQLVTAGARSARVAPFDVLVVRAASHANSARRERIDVEPLIVDFLRHESARKCLGRIGVSRDELLRAYVGTEARATGPIDGPAEVIFHNDDFTTQSVVRGILERHFGKSSAEARAFMLRVHHDGLASFFVPDGKAAALQIEAALADCAELGMPLRIELCAIPVGGRPQKEEEGLPSF